MVPVRDWTSEAHLLSSGRKCRAFYRTFKRTGSSAEECPRPAAPTTAANTDAHSADSFHFLPRTTKEWNELTPDTTAAITLDTFLCYTFLCQFKGLLKKRQLFSVFPILVEVCLIRAVYPIVYDRPTLRESLSGTFLQILPELVTPPKGHSLSPRSCRPTLSGKNQLVIIFVLSDAIVLPGSCFSMHVYLSYVLSLICEAVLCLELVFVELGQAHYK